MMNKLALLLSALASLFATAPADAKPRSASPQEMIAQSIARELRSEPVKVSMQTIRAAIKPAVINTDGIPDYRVDWVELESPGWCGTGGCRYQLWLGVAGKKPRIVFDQQLREATVRQGGGETVFDFDFHGGVCGGYGSEACPASFAYDGALGRMVERVAATGDGVIRFVDPVAVSRAQWPAAISALVAARKASCKAMGAELETDDIPSSIPDVDGDGVRDWVLGRSACVFDGDRPSHALQSRIYATAVLAEVAVADHFDISVAAKPAAVSAIKTSDECVVYSTEQGAKICPRQALRWNAAAGKFMPQ
jgi:hypothetical protein